MQPSRKGFVLKAEYDDLHAQWCREFEGCTCFLSPPCNSCIHEGHPICLENNDDAWEPEVPEEVPLHKLMDRWR